MRRTGDWTRGLVLWVSKPLSSFLNQEKEKRFAPIAHGRGGYIYFLRDRVVYVFVPTTFNPNRFRDHGFHPKKNKKAVLRQLRMRCLLCLFGSHSDLRNFV